MASATSLRLLSLLVEASELDTFLDKVVCLAAEVVTPAAGAGITMLRDGQPFTAATSNNLAAQVDELQHGADEGPYLDALRSGMVIEPPQPRPGFIPPPAAHNTNRPA
jgi:hypothetical protein